MRIVIFTADLFIEETTWWRLIGAAPGLERVLVCRKLYSKHWKDVLRRFKRNVAKHGWVFVPYRVGVLLLDQVRRLARSAEPRRRCLLPVPVDLVEAEAIHSFEILAKVREWRPDLGVAVGAPILKPELFRIPERGTINLHLGKVPDFRGAPPGFWELYTGAREIGATVHWVDESLDTGDVIASAEAPIYERETLRDVQVRAEELGRIALTRALQDLAAGTDRAVPQPAGGRTYRFPTLAQRARLGIRVAMGRWVRRVTDVRYAGKAIAASVCVWVYRPARDLGRTLRRRHPVRVFTFHRVTALCKDGMTVSPEVLRRQVRYVKRFHDVINLEQAVEALNNDARLRRAAAVLSFDDGYRNVFERARPVLADEGVPGTCFVATDFVGTDRRFAHDAEHPLREHFSVMAWKELETLRFEGWTIGSHSASHARRADCEGATLDGELLEPMCVLRDRLGVERVAMAYPFGGRDDISATALGLAEHGGYMACCSNYGGDNKPGRSRFEVHRIDIGGDHAAVAWKAWVHGIDLAPWRSWLHGG